MYFVSVVSTKGLCKAFTDEEKGQFKGVDAPRSTMSCIRSLQTPSALTDMQTVLPPESSSVFVAVAAKGDLRIGGLLTLYAGASDKERRWMTRLDTDSLTRGT
jgi:hypothetical protein